MYTQVEGKRSIKRWLGISWPNLCATTAVWRGSVSMLKYWALLGRIRCTFAASPVSRKSIYEAPSSPNGSRDLRLLCTLRSTHPSILGRNLPRLPCLATTKLLPGWLTSNKVYQLRFQRILKLERLRRGTTIMGRMTSISSSELSDPPSRILLLLVLADNKEKEDVYALLCYVA